MVDAFADCMSLGAMGRAMWWGGSVAVGVFSSAPGGPCLCASYNAMRNRNHYKSRWTEELNRLKDSSCRDHRE